MVSPEVVHEHTMSQEQFSNYVRVLKLPAIGHPPALDLLIGGQHLPHALVNDGFEQAEDRRYRQGANGSARQEGLTGSPPMPSRYLDGMEKTADPEVATLAAATGSRDPEIGLRAVAALRGLVEVLEALQVDNARALGWSWQDIASRLGVSKQAVHQKHGPRSPAGKGR
jgi:hypothetical protein